MLKPRNKKTLFQLLLTVRLHMQVLSGSMSVSQFLTDQGEKSAKRTFLQTKSLQDNTPTALPRIWCYPETEEK